MEMMRMKTMISCNEDGDDDMPMPGWKQWIEAMVIVVMIWWWSYTFQGLSKLCKEFIAKSFPLKLFIFLDAQASLAPTHVRCPSVRPSHFRISKLWSVTVAKIKKVQKTKSIYFRILLLGGPVNWSPTHSTGPQPIQLVPKNCFLQKSVSVAQIKKNKKTLFYFILIIVVKI